MRRRVIAFAGLVVAPLVACSLVTDLSGLSTGGSPSEGGIDAVSAAVADADAAQPDAFPVGDGGAGEAAAAFCTTGAHAFCADFDEGALATGWSAQQVDSKGAVELSTTHFRSPTSSFHSTIARRASGDRENATLVKELVGPWMRTVLDVDILVDAPAWQSGDINAALLSLSFLNTTGGTFVLYLPIGPTYSQLSGPGVILQLGPAVTDSFFHVHVDLDPATGAVSAIVDGKAFGGTMTLPDGTPEKTVITLGVIGYNAPVPVFSVYYDNVVVDRK